MQVIWFLVLLQVSPWLYLLGLHWQYHFYYLVVSSWILGTYLKFILGFTWIILEFTWIYSFEKFKKILYFYDNQKKIKVNIDFFKNNSSIPSYLKWLASLSWFRYGNEALLINQWEGVNSIDCTNTNGTCPANGRIVLEVFNFDEVCSLNFS